MTLTPEQAAHYKMLAQAHANTPGDLAAAYREIGRLIESLEVIGNGVNLLDHAARLNVRLDDDSNPAVVMAAIARNALGKDAS